MHSGDIIRTLKALIRDWEYENQYLEDMIADWEEHNDPGSDPGLQYEQEMKVEKCWNELSKFCKEHF